MGFRVTGVVQSCFPARGGTEGDLLAEDRLAAARRPDDHHDGASQQTAAQHQVQVRYTRVESLEPAVQGRNNLHATLESLSF